MSSFEGYLSRVFIAFLHLRSSTQNVSSIPIVMMSQFQSDGHLESQTHFRKFQYELR